MPTMRRITLLSDIENAPTVMAWCSDEGWNGFHEPWLTAEQLLDHWRELAACDRNGEWDVTMPFVDEAGDLRIPAVDAWDDREYDTIYAPDSHDESGATYYLLSGLVWSDGDDAGEA